MKLVISILFIVFVSASSLGWKVPMPRRFIGRLIVDERMLIVSK
jgi:hypothetical protein